MAALETVTTLDAFFKEIYAPNISELIPESEILSKMVPFMRSAKQGGTYHQPVLLSREHGISYFGNDESQTLNSPIIAVKKDATVNGAGKAMRTRVSAMAASRATGGKGAFISEMGYAIKSLTQSFQALQEASYWYGDQGLALFTATTSDIASDLATITASEFAPALWIGADGMNCQIYTVTGSGLAKAPDSLVGTAVVSKVDIANRKIYFSTDLGAGGLNLSNSTEYVILRYGQKGYDSKGLIQILSNSSSLFGIDAATYPLWKANQYNVSGSLNYAKVAEGLALGMGRGMMGEHDLIVHSTVFNHLLPDFLTIKDTSQTSGNTKNASRRMDSAADVRNLQHGTDSIRFVVNGLGVDVKSSEYVKPRFGACMARGQFDRIGSSEIRGGMPGFEGGEERVFFEVQDAASVEVRMFSDNSMFTAAPSRSLLFYGIS